MSSLIFGTAGWKKRTSRSLTLGAIVGALVFQGLVGAQAPPPQATDINFFKNFFITGDYAVAGVNLRGAGSGGLATGTINLNISDPSDPNYIPPGADILG